MYISTKAKTAFLQYKIINNSYVNGQDKLITFAIDIFEWLNFTLFFERLSSIIGCDLFFLSKYI